MESIKEIYKIGYGPSSSHTMGPRYAATQYLERNKDADSFKLTLFGSLAATAKGHLTYKVLEEVFAGRNINIESQPEIFLPRHPNALRFEAFDNSLNLIDEWTA